MKSTLTAPRVLSSQTASVEVEKRILGLVAKNLEKECDLIEQLLNLEGKEAG